VTLSSAPSAIKGIITNHFIFSVFIKIFFVLAAATCYIEIILKESDNNVKLIVLDRLIALKEQPNQERVLQVTFLNFSLLKLLNTYLFSSLNRNW